MINKPTVIIAAAILLGAATAEARQHAGQRINALDSALWEQSQWISAPDAQVITGIINDDNDRSADGASCFVTKIRNDKEVVSARWMTTGLGVYSLYVNGRSVGEEILKPGFTHYARTKLSFTYDITDAIALTDGDENVLAVQVTPGWWADKIITPGNHDGMIGRKPAFRSVLELTFADGSKKIYGTNTDDWKAAVTGPVKHAAIFDGEEYDARELPVFSNPGINGRPEVNTEFRGGIFPSEGAEVYRRDDLALAPVKAYKWQGVSGESSEAFGKVNIISDFKAGETMTLNPGETIVIDFGQNCAAVPEFEFKGAEGTTLLCLPGELLNDGNGAKSRGMDGPEGSVHRLNLRRHETAMLLKYTFGDNNGFVSYSPECTFFGYRFISLTADGQVTIKSVKSVPVSSITREMESGTLVTGHPLVNRLISNTLWGMRSNYLSVPTDCPQRNERLGWTADTQVFAETGSFFANTRDFFHKWMRDMRDTQKSTGGFPSVAPFGQYGSADHEMCRFGWSDAGVIVPWVVWKQFGDTAIIDENWEAMEKYMTRIGDARYNTQALADDNGNYQWSDWLSYEPLESCGGGIYYKDENGKRAVRPETYEYWNYLGASYWLADALMMRDMALASGRDASKYSTMAHEARDYISSRFLDADGNFLTPILNTMQTPALFALKNGLVEGKSKENMIKRLRDNFTEHGLCLQTGFLGTSILMPVLTENAMADLAYELLLQRKNPSWLYSVDNGATTIWERWNSYMADSGMGPRGMNSFNHYAYGCVCQWLWETMAGIAADTTDPGFRKIIMKPIPDPRIGFVKAEYQSAAGPVKSEWRYEGDNWIWEFNIPEGSTAEVTLPGQTAPQIYPAGFHKITRELHYAD